MLNCRGQLAEHSCSLNIDSMSNDHIVIKNKIICVVNIDCKNPWLKKRMHLIIGLKQIPTVQKCWVKQMEMVILPWDKEESSCPTGVLFV